MDWKDILLNKEIHFHRISTLIVLMISVSIGIFKIVFPFVHKYANNVILDLSILAFTLLSISIYWEYYRTNYPKGDKKKPSIVIAISTENLRQKTRLTKDYAETVRKFLAKYSLTNSFNLIVLNDHLATRIQNKASIQKFIRRDHRNEFKKDSFFERALEKMNTRLLVYGILVERNSPNNAFFFDIEALIVHAPIPTDISQQLSTLMKEVWKNEIKILENDEINGFRDNAEYLFFASAYMVGLATFISNQFEKSIEIFNVLLEYIKSKEDLTKHQGRIVELKLTSLHFLGLIAHHTGDYKKATQYRKMFFQISPNKYSELLSESLNQVKNFDNPELALSYIEKASKIASDDGTWKYSKLYLLIKLGRFDESLEVLDDILGSSFKGEIDTINQVISYNRNCLIEDHKHIQSNFIIGTFLYKKIGQPIASYEYLDKFCDQTRDLPQWKVLTDRSEAYIKDLDQIMNIQ